MENVVTIVEAKFVKDGFFFSCVKQSSFGRVAFVILLFVVLANSVAMYNLESE